MSDGRACRLLHRALYTFFLHRDKEKSYHIDYVYGNPDFLKEITILKIPKNDKQELSDHVPIYCELNMQN